MGRRNIGTGKYMSYEGLNTNFAYIDDYGPWRRRINLEARQDVIYYVQVVIELSNKICLHQVI